LLSANVADLENNIRELEEAAALNESDKARLADLKAELNKINKKKEEYVEEHPEHKKLVYRTARQPSGEEKQQDVIPQKRDLFNKRGLPKHPERSIYYDPVMNPYGVPPPGMPYIERRQ
jgi:hypothetical protein